jgi:hypothetical protein
MARFLFPVGVQLVLPGDKRDEFNLFRQKILSLKAIHNAGEGQ